MTPGCPHAGSHHQSCSVQAARTRCGSGPARRGTTRVSVRCRSLNSDSPISSETVVSSSSFELASVGDVDDVRVFARSPTRRCRSASPVHHPTAFHFLMPPKNPQIAPNSPKYVVSDRRGLLVRRTRPPARGGSHFPNPSRNRPRVVLWNREDPLHVFLP